TKEGDDELARNQEALRRLERILSREPDAGPPGDDTLKDLTPDDVEDVTKALEDLEQDEDAALLPENATCPDCEKAAKSSGVCPKCGRKDRCGSCGKPGHGRGCMSPQGRAEKGQGENAKNGMPGQGKPGKGEQSREAIEGARKSFITRVGSSREVTR